MSKLRVLDLFSGIGGFSLGLERTGGFETVAFCEIEKYPRRVLKKHWPEVRCYHDVTKLSAAILSTDGIRGIDIITGGFPCQDISIAGKRRGMGVETRSGLWSEIVRLVGELRPRYLIVENVANLLSGPFEQRGGWFGRVLGDLAELRYDAEWENIPAASLGAPHRRERVWIIAYPDKIRRPLPIFASLNAEQDFWHGKAQVRGKNWIFPEMGISRVPVGNGRLVESRTHRMDDGFSDWPHRLAACGNAVVPPIPELIGRAILAAEQQDDFLRGRKLGVR